MRWLQTKGSTACRDPLHPLMQWYPLQLNQWWGFLNGRTAFIKRRGVVIGWRCMLRWDNKTIWEGPQTVQVCQLNPEELSEWWKDWYNSVCIVSNFFFFLETNLKIPHILLRSARWRICIPNVCSEPRICLDFSNLQTRSTWDSSDERQYSSAPSTYKVLKLLLHPSGHADRNPSLPLLTCNV